MTILAWHFVGAALRDGTPIPADGVTLKHTGPLVICKTGLHASERIIDALQYAPGNTICRVECGGKIVRQDDKLAATERTILWRIEGDDLLRTFARQCALDVVHLWDMPEIVRQYLETGDEKIRAAAGTAAWADAGAGAAASAAAWAAAGGAARAAAWAAAAAGDAARAAAGRAAWNAAGDAAWAAAWAAAGGAAGDAAGGAARAAAWATAGGAARAAAWDAAGGAAGDAARDAARAAAGAAQNTKLGAMIIAAHEARS